MDWINNIGEHGPLITFIYGFTTLVKRPIYLSSYLVFTFINQAINVLLKSVIKEPRPVSNGKIDYDQYGMPSGHAQTIFFFITFTYLVNKSVMVLLLELFLSFITLYQRWKYKKHTITQIIVGSLLGIIIAYFSVEAIRIYLKNI
jgi:membrane-associated phospholipid phosphatase